MQHINRLQNMPISFFAMIMGMAGLTIGWEKASQIYHFYPAIYSTLLVLTLVTFVLMAGFYIYKSLYFRPEVIKEWSDPVKMNFVPAVSISLLLFAVAFMQISVNISQAFWVAGSLLHLALTLHVVNAWLHQEKFQILHMNPAWFIPAVGNVIVPIAGVALGHEAISWFFFSIGIVFWMILLVIVFNRIFFHQPLPEKLIPTLFILIAPPAVGFLAYIRLTNSLDGFAQVLYHFSLFITLLLASQLPRFARLPFYLSWWAYSFPLAAMSIASMEMASLSGNAVYGHIGVVILFLLSALVLALFIRTLIAIQGGTICVAEN